ncbi:ClbS/DfsB family four-helix bundle protein [Clostridium sp. D33t1_170424_F3]|uniref:ClbS/DfsB family four-helix bundle protein n=1 Tax=Clostridium sp. D33t1_170424_F3 TaxID=2787099 RepID=UPI0018A9080E|nr:ClbS/DfsB family four-helix bundle protein [Clostridium sp. D33t1_170424_F3]
MPRPSTKPGLIEAAGEQFTKLWALIDSLPEDEQTAVFQFEDRDKNLRDILIHLYEWHQLLLKWIQSNQNGVPAPFLPAPYNWKTYPAMNVGFWEKHQDTPYGASVEMLKESHAQVMQVIEGFTDEELFEKKHFSWTGTTSLGSYCISATSSHYDWAIKKIKRHHKTFKEANPA